MGKLRNNEGTVEQFKLDTSTGFEGFRDGGVNVIIIVERGGGIERLEVVRNTCLWFTFFPVRGGPELTSDYVLEE